MVVKIHLRPSIHGGLRRRIVFSSRICCPCPFDRVVIHCHPVIYGRVHAAFHDVILHRVFGQIDDHRLSGVQEEYIFIRHSSAGRREGRAVFGMRSGALVVHIILVACLFLQQVVSVAVIILGLVVNLVREFDDRVIGALRTGQFLAQDHGPGLHCCKVKAHMEVGRARASLHVEHLHGVICVVLEDVLALLVGREDLVQFLRDLVL